ncbi:MAG TPA: hypothetical protein VHS58_09375 [Acetobacteraceae bacterium]|jgi:hypothetical protein|nr:hypothetical protein [Acetobacteraceae bacterium]
MSFVITAMALLAALLCEVLIDPRRSEHGDFDRDDEPATWLGFGQRLPEELASSNGTRNNQGVGCRD